MENFFRSNFREIFKTSKEFHEIILRMIVSEVARGSRNTFLDQKNNFFN